MVQIFLSSAVLKTSQSEQAMSSQQNKVSAYDWEAGETMDCTERGHKRAKILCGARTRREIILEQR